MNTRLKSVALFEWLFGLCGVGWGLFLVLLHFNVYWWLTVLLVCIAVLLEAIPIPLGKMTTTLMMALPIGAMVVYGASISYILVLVAPVVSPFLHRHRPRFSTIIFNSGQSAISLSVAVFVYHSLIRPGSQHPGLNIAILMALVCSTTAYLVMNHSFVHLLNRFRGQFEFSDMKEAAMADGIGLLMSIPFACLMIDLGRYHPVWASMTMLPLSLISLTLRVHRKSVLMAKIYATTTRLADEFDIQRICDEVAEAARDIVASDIAVVYHMAPESLTLEPRTICSAKGSNFATVQIDVNGRGIVQQALSQHGWTYVPVTKRDPFYEGHGLERHCESLAVFPLVSRGVVQGALVCGSVRPYGFDELLHSVNVLAVQLSVLLSNAGLYQQMQDLSWRDGATGLFNYRYFYEALADRVRSANATGRPLSVAIVDVDFFKKFNDTYGHLAGDAVLKSLGGLLSEHAGRDAIVARYGGEEFGIIMEAPPDEMRAVMERIRIAVPHRVVPYQSYQLSGITVSIGVASFPSHGIDDRDVLLKADSAMYWGAKQQGRNRTAVYSPDLDAQLFVDKLTGLYTHHFINMRVREEFTHGVRRWGVICLDLIEFGRINDQFSFSVGDQILQETSVVIKECLRHSELACRFGGDEFLIVFPNVSTTEVEVIAERIDKAIASHRFHCKGHVIAYVRCRYATSCFAELDNDVELFSAIQHVFSDLNESASAKFG